MKIFYCSVFDNIGYSSDNAKLRELENLGNIVAPYNYRIRGIQLGSNQLFSKKRDQEIVNFCKDWNPDFIIFSKCDGISLETFEECKKIAPLCYWFLDPLVTYSFEEFYEKTRIADFFLCDKKNVLDKARTLNDNCFLVTDGFDRLLEKPKDVEKVYDVSFIGNLYGDRKSKISKINHKVEIINKVFADKHSEAVSKSKINLNFCTTDGQSDRVFKVLAAGGFILSDDWADREEFFVDGEDLVIFKDFEDLNQKINYYLNNDREREKIAQSGREKVQKYTRQQWAKRTIDTFKSFNFAARGSKNKKPTILFAGPWVGEFGWELFAWQGYIRSLSKFYDKIICISSSSSRFLYEDFCDDFIEFLPDSGEYKDSFYKVGFEINGKLIMELIKKNGIDIHQDSLHILVPRRIGDPPRTRLEEKFVFGPLYVSPTYKKLGIKTSSNNLIIHARNRTLRSQDNWPEQKWKILIDKLKDIGYNVISVGLKQESMHVEGTEDKRGCQQQELLNMLASAKCIFGPSSGAMHLASLCGCPQIVWSDKSNFVRYTKNWNPFSAEVLFLSEYDWQPKPEYIFKKFEEWKNENICDSIK